MAAIAMFNTLAYAKKLKEAGVPEKQAEVQAEAMVEIIDDKLATKKDLDELRLATSKEFDNLRRGMDEIRTELKRDMDKLRTELKRDMQELSYKLTIRLGGMLVVAISILSAIVKL